MKTIRLNILFTLAALITMCYSNGMQQPPKKTTVFKKIKTYADAAVEIILLGKAPRNPNELKKLLTIPNDPTPFSNLSKDKQNQIMSLLITGMYTDDFNLATGTINSLSVVNKELNQTFNHPLYCLKIIKGLSRQFNTSDEVVCRHLSMPTAIDILRNQMMFREFCTNKPVSPQELQEKFNTFLKEHYIDLNFTYEPNRATLLIRAIASNALTLIQLLLEAGANPEQANKKNITPLKWATEYNNPQAIQLIKEAIKNKYSTK